MGSSGEGLYRVWLEFGLRFVISVLFKIIWRKTSSVQLTIDTVLAKVGNLFRDLITIALPSHH